MGNRFNGVSEVWKTVESVYDSLPTLFTSLKRGVNEKCRNTKHLKFPEFLHLPVCQTDHLRQALRCRLLFTQWHQ